MDHDTPQRWRFVITAMAITLSLAALTSCAAPPKATLNDDAMELPSLSETVSDLRTRYNMLRSHPWASDQKMNFVRAKRWLLRLSACAVEPDDMCRLVARAVDGELLAIHTYLLRRAADASAGIDSRVQEDF